MSAIDTTFGGLPALLITQWGRTVTFHKAAASSSYSTATGTVTQASTSYTTKAVVTRIMAAELNGTLQSTDYKVLLAPSQIGGNAVTTSDAITFTRSGTNVRAKVVDVTTLEGDDPVMFICIVRPE